MGPIYALLTVAAMAGIYVFISYYRKWKVYPICDKNAALLPMICNKSKGLLPLICDENSSLLPLICNKLV